jgi:hypothetical protein
LNLAIKNLLSTPAFSGHESGSHGLQFSNHDEYCISEEAEGDAQDPKTSAVFNSPLIPFNSASYLFLSHRLAARLPLETVESLIILNYTRILPTGLHYSASNRAVDEKISLCRSISRGVTESLKALAASPLAVQETSIRIIQPILVAAVVLGCVNLARTPMAFIAFGALIVLGCLLYMYRQRVKGNRVSDGTSITEV